MQPGTKAEAQQCDGHPDVIVRTSPSGAVQCKIPNGTALEVLAVNLLPTYCVLEKIGFIAKIAGDVGERRL